MSPQGLAAFLDRRDRRFEAGGDGRGREFGPGHTRHLQQSLVRRAESVDLLFFLKVPPRTVFTVQPENFRLGCTPVVNLFPQIAEPIALNQTKAEYRVVPDVHRPMATEVYSIDYVPFAPRIVDGVIVALVSIGISFVATIYPSWSAARILPAEALRYE